MGKKAVKPKGRQDPSPRGKGGRDLLKKIARLRKIKPERRRRN
jgi:hypothetical protein